MTKILTIIFLTLFLIGNANAIFFSDPLEKCMDRVIKGTYKGNEEYAVAAAKFCKGANKSTSKCMDRLIKSSYKGNEEYAVAAAKFCNKN